jgi:L-lactate dehydrogenase complex protein LldF
MTTTLKQFRKRAARSIADDRLQDSLENATDRFVHERIEALSIVPEIDRMRDHFKEIRAATIANLAIHLEKFEGNAVKAGAQVYWAKTGDEADRP